MTSSGAPSKAHLLLEAAFQGDLRRLKKLAADLDDGRGIKKTIASIRDRMNQSALHLAAKEGMIQTCNYLIDKVKLDIDEQGAKGETPLLNAIVGGHISTATFLLKKGANPDLRNDKGFSPLHYAAEKGDGELLRLLLSKGVNVDALSSTGTPLQIAASQGKHEAVKVLLDHCANPGLFFHHVPTPLSAAIIAKSLRCVELLLEASADPDAISCGVTPLNLAASEGETEMIKCLLKAGADPDLTDENGLAPIEIAALSCNHQIVQILYPVTSPIRTYSDWSFGGILRHAHSEKAREQSKLKVKEKIDETKSKGGDAFRRKDYGAAILWYTKAINADPCDAALLSNRSLCWARMKDGERALSDAKACIVLKPDWSKAHYREGAAWTILGKFDKASDAFHQGLKLDPGNKELQDALQEAVEARMKSANVNQGS